MDYEIETKEIPSQRIASIREKTTKKELGATLERIFGEVFGHLKGRGVPGHPPIAVYHEFSEQSVDVEGGIAAPADLNPKGRIGITELAGGKVAITNHFGPYEKLPEAYDAIQKWAADEGIKLGAPPREIYWNDPGDDPDPPKLRTEVVWPID